MINKHTPRRSGASEAKLEVTLTSPKPRKESYGSTIWKLYSSRSAIGFLQRAATTRSSTPSPSRSIVNCGGPTSSVQLSPNCLCTNSSVTAGEGALADAGGGAAGFFDRSAAAELTIDTTNKPANRRISVNLREHMALLYAASPPMGIDMDGNGSNGYFLKYSHPSGLSSHPMPSRPISNIFRRRTMFPIRVIGTPAIREGMRLPLGAVNSSS